MICMSSGIYLIVDGRQKRVSFWLSVGCTASCASGSMAFAVWILNERRKFDSIRTKFHSDRPFLGSGHLRQWLYVAKNKIRAMYYGQSSEIQLLGLPGAEEDLRNRAEENYYLRKSSPAEEVPSVDEFVSSFCVRRVGRSNEQNPTPSQESDTVDFMSASPCGKWVIIASKSKQCSLYRLNNAKVSHAK